MLIIEKSIVEVANYSLEDLSDYLLESDQPLIFRGIVNQWPAVAAAKQSPKAIDEYLRRFYKDRPVTAVVGSPEVKGRVFYNNNMDGFDFQIIRAQLDNILDKIQEFSSLKEPPLIYIGSTDVDLYLPGFRGENDLELNHFDPLVSAWIGNKTRVAAHYDTPDNLACVVAGRRKFTLFPPDQLANLYIGPIDVTPAGQAISLVDFYNPDYQQFPKFHEAIKHAQVAELVPGDALFIPSMWWHHVEGLDDFNMLINYWWKRSPAFMGTPMDALKHCLLSIRDLPVKQRKAWENIFSYYIFNPDESNYFHIPESGRGLLAPLDDKRARQLRALLINGLNC